MARPREFDENEIKERMMCVFWEKGYEGTSMQDLVDATGLLKGSLYGAFGDKQSMYLTALAHYDQTHIQAGIDMLNGGSNVQVKVAHLFDSIVESMKTTVFAGGCLLCNASVEMAAVDKNVQKAVQLQIKRLENSIRKAIGNNLSNEKEVSAFIVSAYFGARVLAKAGMPIERIVATKEQCLRMVSK